MSYTPTLEYLRWTITDEHGIEIGVRDDAPESVKKEYWDRAKARNPPLGELASK